MSVLSGTDAALLQERMIAFVRAFGLHRPSETPCGKPVPVSEAHALMELARGGGMTQSELGLCLRLEKSTVSRLVGNLVVRGWLERERDPSDGRAMLLALTERGRRAAAELDEARRQKFAALFDGIPEEDREQVVRVLASMTDALDDAS
jgi:DNA-binding MarR family transcriptional regulator